MELNAPSPISSRTRPVTSIETLLKVIAAAMLGIAIFAVGAMVSAYPSASSTATPRSLPRVIADDVSQNALSAFLGAFVYSIVALIALQNGYYAEAGHLFLLVLTLAVLAFVIANFYLDRSHRAAGATRQYSRHGGTGPNRGLAPAQRAAAVGGLTGARRATRAARVSR